MFYLLFIQFCVHKNATYQRSLAIYLQVWDPSVTFNVTCVCAHSHSDVTGFSPGRGPGVSDCPVFFSFVISYVDNSMVIRSVGAVGIFEDSIVIMTPVVVDIYVNCMRSIIVNTISKGISAFIMNIDEIVARNTDSRSERFAGVAIGGMVGIISFSTISSFPDNGIKTIIGPSSITITLSTINQHLFREVNFVISGHSPNTFNRSNRCKSPTTSTRLLISDSSHNIFPIVGVWVISCWSNGFGMVFFFGILILNLSHQDCVCKFIKSQIRILVDCL